MMHPLVKEIAFLWDKGYNTLDISILVGIPENKTDFILNEVLRRRRLAKDWRRLNYEASSMWRQELQELETA